MGGGEGRLHGALDGETVEGLLRQHRQLRQDAHVVDGRGEVVIEGIGNDIHRAFGIVHQHVVAGAVSGGLAEGELEGLAGLGVGGGEGGGGLVQAVGLQSISVGDGLLGA